MSNRKQGLERYSRDPGFGQNTERGSGNVSGIHNVTATWKSGFAKVWAQLGIGKKRIFGTATTLGILVKKERECGIGTLLYRDSKK